MRQHLRCPNAVVTLGWSAAISLSLTACSLLSVEERGSTCGGAQYAVAHISLPDSGISAGTELVFAFTQRDPYLIGEQTDISIQQLPTPPAALAVLPHVRLVHDDGRVLLDQSSTPASFGETWRMIFITHNADIRNAIFDGLQTQGISLQLLRWPTDQLGTKVRIRTDELGVSPVQRCL